MVLRLPLEDERQGLTEVSVEDVQGLVDVDLRVEQGAVSSPDSVAGISLPEVELLLAVIADDRRHLLHVVQPRECLPLSAHRVVLLSEEPELVTGELFVWREDPVAQLDESVVISPDNVPHRGGVEHVLLENVQHGAQSCLDEPPRESHLVDAGLELECCNGENCSLRLTETYKQRNVGYRHSVLLCAAS